MWQPTNQPPAAVVASGGTTHVTSIRWPEPTTTRTPSNPSGSGTTGVGPGGAPMVAASAVSHASWLSMAPVTASWFERPTLMTWSNAVSPGTRSTTDGTYE